jgi:hypothetical protein
MGGFFQRLLREGGKMNLVLCALALAVANLLKFSMLVLYPTLVAIGGFYFLFTRRYEFIQSIKRLIYLCIPLFLAAFVATVGVYYLAFPRDVLSADIQLDALTVNYYYQYVAPLSSIARVPVLRPLANYLAGAVSVVGRVGSGADPIMLGELRNGGSALFFPLSFALKETIPAVAGTLLALGFLAFLVLKRREQKILDGVSFILIPLIIYGSFAVASRFNLGIRHILPAIAMAYFLVGWAVSYAFSREWKIARIAVSLGGLWILLSTFLASPNFIAYFNESVSLIRMPRYEIFVDSNLDWGQNLIRLRKFLSKEGIKEVNVDAWYPYRVIKQYVPQAIEGDSASWKAISSTGFQYARFRGDDHFASLRNIEPYAVVGDGILVFRVK